MSGADIETYTFAGEKSPSIPGATWADGRPGPAPNVSLTGLDRNKPDYLPLDVIMRRTYESNDHGWIEVKGNHNNRAGWRGAKKSRKTAAPKQSLDELIIGLSGKSYLVV
jgi:hypothetical protein